TGEVQLGDLQNTAWRGMHFSSCGIGCAGKALHFKSTAIGNRVTFGFLDEHDNVLCGLCPCRILRRDGDAIEDAQVIESALCVRTLSLVGRRRGVDLTVSWS